MSDHATRPVPAPRSATPTEKALGGATVVAVFVIMFLGARGTIPAWIAAAFLAVTLAAWLYHHVNALDRPKINFGRSWPVYVAAAVMVVVCTSAPVPTIPAVVAGVLTAVPVALYLALAWRR